MELTKEQEKLKAEQESIAKQYPLWRELTGKTTEEGRIWY